MLFQYAEPNDSLQTALSELGHELERLMNFYRYSLNNRNQVFEELVLSGDVERIAEVANYLAERLNVKIVHFQTNRIDGLPQDSRLFSSLAVPIGLALRGKQR